MLQNSVSSRISYSSRVKCACLEKLLISAREIETTNVVVDIPSSCVWIAVITRQKGPKRSKHMIHAVISIDLYPGFSTPNHINSMWAMTKESASDPPCRPNARVDCAACPAFPAFPLMVIVIRSTSLLAMRLLFDHFSIYLQGLLNLLLTHCIEKRRKRKGKNRNTKEISKRLPMPVRADLLKTHESLAVKQQYLLLPIIGLQNG
jgi:hypothetical protein